MDSIIQQIQKVRPREEEGTWLRPQRRRLGEDGTRRTGMAGIAGEKSKGKTGRCGYLHGEKVRGRDARKVELNHSVARQLQV